MSIKKKCIERKSCLIVRGVLEFLQSSSSFPMLLFEEFYSMDESNLSLKPVEGHNNTTG